MPSEDIYIKKCKCGKVHLLHMCMKILILFHQEYCFDFTESEIERQIELIENGGIVENETRSFDAEDG